MAGDLEARVREALRMAEVTGLSATGTRRAVERALSGFADAPKASPLAPAELGPGTNSQQGRPIDE